MDGVFARCTTNTVGSVARLAISKDFDMEGVHVSLEEKIKNSAKHEVMHLLLGEMSDIASARYRTYDELMAAEERVVGRLVKFIN